MNNAFSVMLLLSVSLVSFEKILGDVVMRSFLFY